MRINLIFVSMAGFIALACAANTLAEDKSDSIVLPSDTVVVRHDTPPKFVKEVEPEYPRIPKEAGFSGYVEIKAFVDSTGKILKVLYRCNRPNMGFEEAALKATYQGELTPATLKGKPVGVWIRYKVTFHPKYGVMRRAINSYDLKWSK